jgi:hypothetical protein
LSDKSGLEWTDATWNLRSSTGSCATPGAPVGSGRSRSRSSPLAKAEMAGTRYLYDRLGGVRRSTMHGDVLLDAATAGGAAPGRTESGLRLLRAGGFLIESVHLGAGFTELVAVRYDELGVPVRYVIGIADARFDEASAAAIGQLAERLSASKLLISDELPAGESGLRWSEFVARMGGAIPSLLPLDPTYRERLISLGRGERPTGLDDGDVEDLYETYVFGGLEFLIGARVVRYGASRRFKPVPDGLLLPVRDPVAVLYDAKAYAPSFRVERDDVRRFGDYVRRYNEQYAHHSGPARSFLVVSTSFSQAPAARQNQSNQLLADVGVPLSFLTSEVLAAAVDMLAGRPWLRNVLRWREIFAPLDVTSQRLEVAIREADADRVRA